MNINYKQPQFELFPGNSSTVDETKKPRIFLANLTLSAENLVVLGILGIMVSVFAYSLGLERGKSLMAMQQPKDLPMEKPIVTAAAVPTVTTSTAPVAKVQPTTPAVKMTAAAPAVPTVVSKASPTVAEQKPVKPGNYKFTIQVASYKDEKFAHKEAVNLKKIGLETLVMQKGKYAILCVGRFSQKKEATSVISRLKSKYKDCLVRSM